MNDPRRTQASAVAEFRALHASGCFLLPNPWDAGSAVFLHRLGCRALASTSSGFAFSRALPDEVWAIPVDAQLAHLRELVNATPLPVNADFQSGYARDPEGVAANVARCIATGVAGLSIEDATGEPGEPLYERNVALERLRAARRAIDASGMPVVLTARCEAYLVGTPDAPRVALDRLVAFADAGADCLFAPGAREPREIAALVKAVAPKPVNVLVSAPTPVLSLRLLEDLGVRRVSIGSALSRVAWGAFMRAAKSLVETGSFEALGDAARFSDLNELFAKQSTRANPGVIP
jgi:2-methylisocitrate lyase-like PEP mutase family enzyme